MRSNSNNSAIEPSGRKTSLANANKYLIIAGLCAATTAMLEKVKLMEQMDPDPFSSNSAMGHAYLDISIYSFAISTAGLLAGSGYEYANFLFPETTAKVSNYVSSFFSSRPHPQEELTGSYTPPRPTQGNI